MRDLSQWKDKVELRLDGRQLFFVFFGGATLACLLFTLGVMTGRRLEARAIALETPATDDPLALLDQLGDLEDEELSYHQTLTKGGRQKDESKPAAPTVKPAVAAPKPAAPTVPPPKPAAPKPAAGKPAAAHAENDADAEEAPVVAAAAPVAPAPKPVAAPVAAAPKPATNVSHFTLQLSAFAVKKDAEDFLHRVQAAGYRAFVVSSEVPGRGVMHRVRVGDYSSKELALAEKTGVEKKLKVVAYLAKL